MSKGSWSTCSRVSGNPAPEQPLGGGGHIVADGVVAGVPEGDVLCGVSTAAEGGSSKQDEGVQAARRDVDCWGCVNVGLQKTVGRVLYVVLDHAFDCQP